MTAIPFTKMHGLGNDFVIIDARRRAVSLTPDSVRAIAARQTGIGCDQLIVMEPPGGEGADLFMRIHNAEVEILHFCGLGNCHFRCPKTLVNPQRLPAASDRH